MSSSCALCCLPSVKKQKHDFQVYFVDLTRHRKNSRISLFTIVMFISVKLIYCYLLSQPAFIHILSNECLDFFRQLKYVPMIFMFLHV